MVSVSEVSESKTASLNARVGLAFGLLALLGGCGGELGATGDRGGPQGNGGAPSGLPGADGVPGAPASAQPGVAGGAMPGTDGAPGTTDADPGRVTLHRLNRVEYQNTVEDLLGTTQRPSDDFPTDDRGYGFDNIADVLSLSPLLFEMYFGAAEALVDEALTVLQVGARRFEAEAMTASTGVAGPDGSWSLYSTGSVSQVVQIDSEGRYRLRARVWADQGGPAVASMSIDVDGLPAETFDVNETAASPAVYETEVMISAGAAALSVSFLNDFYDQASGVDRNLHVDWLEIEGPLGVASDNPLRAGIMTCEPDPSAPEACWGQVARSFASRAYRRPVSDDEAQRLVALAVASRAAGDPIETATRTMLQAVLMSPSFLFRVELDADPTDLSAHSLSDHELASRLSYFIWSSMPDAELLDLADEGQLSSPEVLRGQVTRMLGAPRASALLDNFAGQWLYVRQLDEHEPDYVIFPEFDSSLRGAMRGEVDRYLRRFLYEGAPLDELLTARVGYVNERLAGHYGIAGVSGSALQEVSLAGTPRAGLLTQAGMLMVTSYATRTSPVKRGHWVLTQLMCQAPPPPPPNIPALMEEAEGATGSVRERMEQHRKNPVCAGCHATMDPIGFGLEHFDAIGGYRTIDNGQAIDATGELPDGRTFDGAVELGGLLADDPQLYRCMAEQLLTYALGRGIEPYDVNDVERITESFVASGYRMDGLVTAVVLSDAFRMRRGESPLADDSMEVSP